MVFVPRIHTVLEAVAHQGAVDAHVTVAEEGAAFAGGWKQGEGDAEAITGTQYKSLARTPASKRSP